MSAPPRAAAVLAAALAAHAPLALTAPAAAAPRPAAPAPVRPPAPQPPESFAERVVVREIEVVVELPDTLRESRRKSLAPQDFQVVEDGRFRQVVKAAPVAAGEAGAWQLVIYCDRVLADADTVFSTANALAQRAEQLTSLGTVALVVADPAPRFVLAETREPKMLEQALIDIAAQAGRDRDAARQAKPQAAAAALRQAQAQEQEQAGAQGPGQKQGPAAGRTGGQAQAPGQGSAAGRATGQAPPRQASPRLETTRQEQAAAAAPDPEAVRRQEDRLISLLAGRASSGPRALVLVANGFDTSHSGDGADSATAAVAEEPARTLAAYGWITIAAAMRRQDVGVAHREITDLERIRQSNAGREAPGSSVPPEILPQAAPKSRLQYDGVLGVFVEPTSASLHAMASATAGTVAGFPTQLTAALTGLAKRWHVYYLAPDPEDGRPRPVEVRLSPEGTPLRAPVWRRSSTPEEVSAARLRQILAGGPGHGTLPVTATASAPAPSAPASTAPAPAPAPRSAGASAAGATPAAGAGGRRSLRVAVGAYSVPDSAAAGPFRVSIAFAGAAGAVPAVQHRLLIDARLTEKGWTETLPLDLPPGTRKVGVAVEDLGHQLWGATEIDLAPFTLPASH
jgi:hypothetical protein